jgi:Fuc2NAc and GlcNAc transferase
MGDVGSVFLGFAFAVFAVKLSTTVSVFLCVAMFLCTFYADALVTIFYRWKNGEDLMKAHRSHLYQYLSNELRISHWKVTVAFAVIQSVFGALSLVSYKAAMSWQITVFGMFGITFVIAYKFIKGNRQVTERQRGE